MGWAQTPPDFIYSFLTFISLFSALCIRSCLEKIGIPLCKTLLCTEIFSTRTTFGLHLSLMWSVQCQAYSRHSVIIKLSNGWLNGHKGNYEWKTLNCGKEPQGSIELMIPSWGCNHRQSLVWKDSWLLPFWLGHNSNQTDEMFVMGPLFHNNTTLSTVINNQIFVSYFFLLKLRTKLQFPGCQKSLISKKRDITQSDLSISSRSQWLCRLWC